MGEQLLWFLAKKTFSRGISKFSKTSYRQLPFQMIWVQEFSVEWFAFRKINTSRTSWISYYLPLAFQTFWNSGRVESICIVWILSHVYYYFFTGKEIKQTKTLRAATTRVETKSWRSGCPRGRNIWLSQLNVKVHGRKPVRKNREQ